jgi:hypothetical protein
VGYDDTLALSLAQLFGSSGQGPGGNQGGGPSGHVSAQVLQLLTQAQQFYRQAQAALKSGDLALYATDISQEQALLNRALKLAQGPGKAPPPGKKPAPSPSPSR